MDLERQVARAREDAAELFEQASEIRDRHAGKSMPEEEATKLGELLEQFDAADKRYDRLSKDLEAAEIFGSQEMAEKYLTPAPRSIPEDAQDKETAKGEMHGFKSPAEFWGAVARSGRAGTVADNRLQRSNETMGTSLQEGAGASGGFLVPPEIRNELLRTQLETALIRPRARVIPMGSNTLSFPRIAETTHSGSTHGGIIIYREREAASITASRPDFGKVELNAHKNTGLARLSNELLADSAQPLASLIPMLFNEAFTFDEEDQFLNGGGAGEAIGVLNTTTAAYKSVAKETGQPADTVVYKNIVKMWAGLLPSSAARAVWLYNPSVFPELAELSVDVGTGGSAVWLTNAAAGPPMTIMGRPAFPTEHCATLGDFGDIVLADFSYYLIGDRQDLVVRASSERYVESDETIYVFTKRFDGKPWLEGPITLKDGTNTVSPFVALAERA